MNRLINKKIRIQESVKKANARFESKNDDINKPTHNPTIEVLPSTSCQVDICKFFIKTGACKYGNLCNKAHMHDSNQNSFIEPMNTLIIPGMYRNMLLGYELLQIGDDCGNCF